MAHHHQHTPLMSSRSIRILALEPAFTHMSPVQCTLQEVSIDDAEHSYLYEALSYVWGSPTGTLEITCDKQTLLVTKNCMNALRNLRYVKTERILWIDAICIDQRPREESILERNGQVKMMGEIYQRASKVVVWLGVTDRTVEKLLLLLDWIGRWELGSRRKNITKEVKQLITAHVTKPLFSASYIRNDGYGRLALQRLLTNVWFERIWTVQEIVFAKRCELVLGTTTVVWEQFVEGLSYAATTLPFQLRSPLLKINLRTRLKSTMTIWQDIYSYMSEEYAERLNEEKRRMRLQGSNVVSDLSQLHATNNIDKIFGIYSILEVLGIDTPDPDYRKAASDVFQETVLAIVRNEGSLNILKSTIRSNIREGSDLVSWTPDWLHSSTSRSLMENGLAWDLWNAAPDSKSDCTVAYNPSGQLTVQGKFVGQIQRHSILHLDHGDWETEEYDGNSYDYNGEARTCIKIYREWVSMTADVSVQVPREKVLCDFFGAVSMMRGSYQFDDELNAAITSRRNFDFWYDLYRYPHCQLLDFSQVQQRFPDVDPEDLIFEARYNEKWPPVLANGLDMARAFDRALGTHTASAVFFIMNTGFMGLSHHTIVEDDVVAILAGSDCPMVLRLKGEHFQVISPAYVQGFMEGEQWDEIRKSLEPIVLV